MHDDCRVTRSHTARDRIKSGARGWMPLRVINLATRDPPISNPTPQPAHKQPKRQSRHSAHYKYKVQSR